MLRFSALLLVALTSAASAQNTEPPAPQSPPQNPLIASAKAAVLKQLRDPASARFSNVRAKSAGTRQGVCGVINAKNAAGGMSGPQLFVFDGKLANVLVLAAGPDNPTSFGADVLAMIYKRGSDNYQAFCK
jgi:hypothetical protein